MKYIKSTGTITILKRLGIFTPGWLQYLQFLCYTTILQPTQLISNIEPATKGCQQFHLES